jgi:hypothetical protein
MMLMNTSIPSPTELHDLFTYNPETGTLTWKKTLSKRRSAGMVAGCSSSSEKGRISVGINGKIIRAHRIIWAMQTGEWPTNQIDHVNENPSDNRWSNLREASKSQNMRNITRIRSNTSGHKGVGLFKRTGKWRAYIKINRKNIHLGYFNDKDSALCAYINAAHKYHEEFARY